MFWNGSGRMPARLSTTPPRRPRVCLVHTNLHPQEENHQSSMASTGGAAFGAAARFAGDAKRAVPAPVAASNAKTLFVGAPLPETVSYTHLRAHET